MSIVVSNCHQICQSPTNNSKSKMLYSFPKSIRFSQRNKSLCHTFYETSKKFSPRTTSFGYGNKYDFTKSAPMSPPPNTYQIISDFNKSKSKKGFGFGSGRQQMQITGPLVQMIKNKNPGPGSYLKNAIQTNQLVKTSYTMGKKLNKDDSWKKIIPGPGQYQSYNTINQNGTYFLSKYKNSKVPSMSLLRRKDINNQNNPGPGKYQLKDFNLSPEGKYSNSKCHNSYARHFPKQNRSSLVSNVKTPGPGYYRLPSQFGYYESAKSYKQNISNRTDKENKPSHQ